MSTPSTIARPFEEEALFNPALLALLVRAAAHEHVTRSRRSMPVALGYVVAPLALHGPTRRSLPSNVTAQMGEWVRLNPEALVGLAERTRALRPFVSAGIRLGLRHQLIRGEPGALTALPLPRRPRGMARSGEVDACLTKAGYLGRWFSEQPDWTTALAWWGLRA